MTVELNCSKCGEHNKADARFCSGCGAVLSFDIPSSLENRESLIGSLVFGRFKVLDKIGEGGMGAVYRAEQTSIKRPVALKVLSSRLSDRPRLRDRFHNEASLASRLNHPNTVTIYDFDITEEGTMFIAMELIQGKSLDQELAKCEFIEWRRACNIAEQICSSLQNAHDNNIIHRDLKPENIMLTTAGGNRDHVKVLDFGLATILAGEDNTIATGLTAPNEIFGTPDYMSPEQAKGNKLDHRTDIYSFGVVFYRMLTGCLPFKAGTAVEMMAKHIVESPKPFMEVCQRANIPPQLELLVMSVLSKAPEDRAVSMNAIIEKIKDLLEESREIEILKYRKELQQPVKQKAVLQPIKHKEAPQPAKQKAMPQPVKRAEDIRETVPQEFNAGKIPLSVQEVATKPEAIEPEAAIPRDFPKKTPGVSEPKQAVLTSHDTPSEILENKALERLLHIIKRKKDFPVFGKTLSELNIKVGMSTTSASQIANLILKDSSITAKLLRLVNSSFYGHLQGRVTMISRAVVLMGFDTVRDTVMGSLVFDRMMSKDPKQAEEIRNAAVSSLATAVISREVAKQEGDINYEEAYICGMLKDIGKQAMLFYFPEEMQKVKELIREGRLNEAQAVRQVLDVSYEELGKELARQWNFPKQILATMVELPPGKLSKANNKTDRLNHITSFAREFASVAMLSDPEEKKTRFKELTTRFGSSIRMNDDSLNKLMEKTSDQIVEQAKVMFSGLNDNALKVNLIKAFGKPEDIEKIEQQKHKAAEEEQILGVDRIQGGGEPAKAKADRAQNTLIAKENILSEGIDEVASSLKGRCDLNIVTLMVLETMYRGLALNRVIFCLNDVQQGIMRAKTGFGENIEEIVKNFQFKLKGPPDVFRRAMTQGRDIIIRDIKSPKFSSEIPKWYKDAISAPMILLYPIRIKRLPIALFYGDFNKPGVQVEEALLSKMNELRDHAAKAIIKSYTMGSLGKSNAF